jgi:serine/threonine protein kinase
LKIIGEGTTAIVFLANYRREQVAIKEILPTRNEGIDKKTFQAVQRELNVLSQVNHPSILKFIGLVNECDRLRWLLEYCAGGSLFDVLHNRYDLTLSWRQKFKMLTDTSSAQAFLHNFKRPILHRDLKSLNLMLKEEIQDEHDEPCIKLADFGFARVEEKRMTQCVGTTHWMAPEVINSTEYTQKADVFSFAMVAYEVVCRHVPFEHLDSDSVGDKITSGQRPSLTDPDVVPEEAPPNLLDLIVRCWAHEPSHRPCFKQIHSDICEFSQAFVEKFSF